MNSFIFFIMTIRVRWQSVYCDSFCLVLCAFISFLKAFFTRQFVNRFSIFVQNAEKDVYIAQFERRSLICYACGLR